MYNVSDWITFDEAYALYFKNLIGKNKLRDMVRQKLIPTVDIPTKKTIFSKAAIDAWIKEKSMPDEKE